MKKGFTLVELLVVIAIIGILTAIITTNLTQAKSKSRDAKRISDISQIQLAIELYADKCSQYPSVARAPSGDMLPDISDGSGCPSGSGITLGTYISQLPTAPVGGGYSYTIKNSPPTDYVLRAQLENDSSLDRFKDLNSVWTGSGVSCAGGKDYCITPR